MISRQDLEVKYAGYSTEELLDVIRNKDSYTEIAVTVAAEEISRRNISSEEIAVMEVNHQVKREHFLENFARVEMNIVLKIFFFVLWIPILHFVVKQRLAEDGYILKVKQAGYYSITGFLFLFLAIYVSSQWLPAIGLVTWPLGFLIAVALEKIFVKRDF